MLQANKFILYAHKLCYFVIIASLFEICKLMFSITGILDYLVLEFVV